MARIYVADILDRFIFTLAILETLANISVCLLVLTSKQLRTYVNAFLISLAVSDILTSVTLFVGISFGENRKTKYEKAFIKYLVCATTVSEIGNLCAVSFERYLAVVKPFQYKTQIKKLFLWIVTTIWSVSLLGSLLVFLRFTDIIKYSDLKKMYMFFAFIFVIIPFLFMIILYIRIYLELRKQKRRVNILRQVQQLPSNLRRNREAKVVKIFSLVAFLYAASWIPAIAYELVEEIQDFRLPGSDYTSFAIQLFIAGSVISSLANPFIYAFAKQDFKRQIQRIYQKIRYNFVSSTAFSVTSSSASSNRGINRDMLNLDHRSTRSSKIQGLK